MTVGTEGRAESGDDGVLAEIKGRDQHHEHLSETETDQPGTGPGADLTRGGDINCLISVFVIITLFSF